MAITQATATREGKSLDAKAVLIFNIEDGKVTEVWNSPWDQAAVDDFWS